MRQGGSEALRAGPFRERAREFVQHLRSRGYTANTIRVKLQFLAEMSRWSVRRRAAVFDEVRLREFLRDPRHRYRTTRGVGATGLQIIQFLRASGDLPPAAPVARPGRASQIESEYAVYLREERGVAEGTVAVYLRMVHAFVNEYLGGVSVRSSHGGLSRPPEPATAEDGRMPRPDWTSVLSGASQARSMSRLTGRGQWWGAGRRRAPSIWDVDRVAG